MLHLRFLIIILRQFFYQHNNKEEGEEGHIKIINQSMSLLRQSIYTDDYRHSIVIYCSEINRKTQNLILPQL